ncbi:unnamed protein product [Paramecium sonneborni]|uniref:Protein kinase domain-containing protein n=1 Tax=Paramecium sonneborni TaxID=65129 RepID=A0A8S1P8E4_9CILI|nr:unnamed protein product [Paramecium sonneborni]
MFKDLICIGKLSFYVQVLSHFKFRFLNANLKSTQNQEFNGLKLKSVIFQIGGQKYEYHGANDQLRELKQKCSLLVFQIKIQDEYQAESVLGKGSYATVLELTNQHTNRQQTAKFVDQQRINEKKNGYKQLQQDMAKGGSLLTLMKKRQTLFSRSDIKLIMKQLLDGLAFIHIYYIMHRDLKPENILFMNKDLESLVIADFGLAQSVDSHPILILNVKHLVFLFQKYLNKILSLLNILQILIFLVQELFYRSFNDFKFYSD